MMRSVSYVLFLVFLPGGARRTIRISGSRHGALQRNNTLATRLELSAEARDVFAPAGFGTGGLPPAGPLPRGVSEDSKQAGHRAAPMSRQIQRHAEVALQAVDPFLSKESLSLSGVDPRDYSFTPAIMPRIQLHNSNGISTDDNYVRAKVQMSGSGQGGGAMMKQKAKLRTPFSGIGGKPPTKPPKAGGGGGGDEDFRRVLENDKFVAKGMFAKYIVGRIMPAPEGNFLREVANIDLVREKLKEDMPFKAAFDLETKRMHFYVRKTEQPKMAEMAKMAEECNPLTNDDHGIFEGLDTRPPTKYSNQTIKLNQDTYYVQDNLMKDVEGIEQLNQKTELPEDAIFVSYDFVQDFLAETLKDVQAGTHSLKQRAERKGVFGAVKGGFKSIFSR